jgi:hypothetical protein
MKVPDFIPQEDSLGFHLYLTVIGPFALLSTDSLILLGTDGLEKLTFKLSVRFGLLRFTLLIFSISKELAESLFQCALVPKIDFSKGHAQVSPFCSVASTCIGIKYVNTKTVFKIDFNRTPSNVN